jgi:hypothetical protein
MVSLFLVLQSFSDKPEDFAEYCHSCMTGRRFTQEIRPVQGQSNGHYNTAMYSEIPVAQLRPREQDADARIGSLHIATPALPSRLISLH